MKDQERIDGRIREMYDEGRKDSEIASILRIPARVVMHRRHKMKLLSKRRGYLAAAHAEHREKVAESDYLPEDIETRALVYSLAAEGVPARKIAERVDRPVEFVQRIAADMPEDWRMWGGNYDRSESSRIEENVMRGSRRGGGKKRVPE